MPLAGPALGVVTALAAPLTYPLSFALAWPDPNASGAALWAAASDPELYDTVRWLAYNEVMVPCLAVTGAVSGLLLHVGLEPLVVGRPGWPWPRLAGAVLAAVGVGLCALYAAALRVELPHLRDAVATTAPPGAAWWQKWWPDRTACYVDGEDELFWVPRLDDATGELVSRRLRLRRLNAVGGGGGVVEYAFEEVGSKAADGGRAVEAAALRGKLADGRLACYASRRAAFFDGTPGAAPLERTHLREMAEALAVGEGLLTDATVLLVAGAVDAQTVERALGRCLPLLASSALADRVRARPDAFNPLARSSWADAAAPAAALPALVAEVRLRRAQLAELTRLERGAAPAGHSRAALTGELERAGVDVDRARDALRRRRSRRRRSRAAAPPTCARLTRRGGASGASAPAAPRSGCWWARRWRRRWRSWRAGWAAPGEMRSEAITLFASNTAHELWVRTHFGSGT